MFLLFFCVFLLEGSFTYHEQNHPSGTEGKNYVEQPVEHHMFTVSLYLSPRYQYLFYHLKEKQKKRLLHTKEPTHPQNE